MTLKDFDEEYNLHTEEGLMLLFEDQVNGMLAEVTSRPPPPDPTRSPRRQDLPPNSRVQLPLRFATGPCASRRSRRLGIV